MANLNRCSLCPTVTKRNGEAHPHGSLVSQVSQVVLFFCKCPLLWCYTLVLYPLFLGVGFGPSLASFWGCLRPVSCALVCFRGSLKPSIMKLGKIFTNPLIKLLEIRWISQHGSFSSYCLVGVALY